MPIYLLRHGETEWNRTGRRQGRGDSPLTPLGVQQVRACAAALATELPSDANAHLVSSPLGRARQSAEILRECLADRFSSCEVAEALAEHAFGVWEGLTNEQIEARFPEEWARRQANRWEHMIPGGESYVLVAKRAARWLAQQDAGATVVAVAHDAVSRVLRGLYLRLATEETLELTHPHTRIHVLADGAVRFLDAQACPT